METIGVEEAIEIYQEYEKNKKYDDIFLMQIHGIDPKEVPVYKEFLSQKEKNKEQKKAEMSTEEVKIYKGIFDKSLKSIKNG